MSTSLVSQPSPNRQKTAHAVMPIHPQLQHVHLLPDHHYCFCASMYSNRMLTALLCASSSSTLASCITAPPTFRSPSAVRWELVMCLTNDARLTPEYCLA